MNGINFVADTNFPISVHEGLSKNKIKTPDASIAATAGFLNLPLVSSDKEFKKIKGIKIILI